MVLLGRPAVAGEVGDVTFDIAGDAAYYFITMGLRLAICATQSQRTVIRKTENASNMECPDCSQGFYQNEGNAEASATAHERRQLPTPTLTL